MFKPISNSLKSHFNKLYQIAYDKAQCEYSSVVLAATKDLNHFDGLSYLVSVVASIDKRIEEDKHPYYIRNSNNKEWLLDLFANRSYLLNLNESDELINSIYLGQLNSLVLELIINFKEEIPPYSFDQFISGQICEYFSNFKEYYNITSEDYYKIREWQTQSLLNIVSYERLVLIKNIQEHCKFIENPFEFIKKEYHLTESLFNLENPSVIELISILKELHVLSNFDFSKFDKNELLFSFNEFKNENNQTYIKIIPKNIQPLLDLLNEKPVYLFSNEYTLFYTLDKLLFWYEKVLNGKSIFENVEEEDWDLILEQILEEADFKVDTIIDEINSFCYNGDTPKSDIKKYLRDTFETYRYKFNELENKSTFHTFSKTNNYLLKPMFIVNSFFNNNIENQSNNIIEARVIHDVLWEIVVVYCEIFGNKRQIIFENNGFYEIFFIMNNLVPDKDVYNQLDKSTQVFMKEFHNYSLPMDLHFQNQKEAISHCFLVALNRLQEILDDAEPTNKILYLQSRIKELKQRELRLKMHEEEHYGKNKRYRNNHKYSNLFKDFLIIEADYVKETSIIPNSINVMLNPIKAIKTINTGTTDSNITLKNQDYILTMLEDLCVTQDGVFALSLRKKSALRGVVEALQEKSLVPNIGIDKLCKVIAENIQLEINSKLDWSKTVDEFKKKALQYIKNNPLS
ncbi:MAG: hypothetical protein ACOYOT_04755 [Bacteroidales bacterium]